MACVIDSNGTMQSMAGMTGSVIELHDSGYHTLHAELVVQHSPEVEEELDFYAQLARLERSRKPQDQLMANSMREQLRRGKYD